MIFTILKYMFIIDIISLISFFLLIRKEMMPIVNEIKKDKTKRKFKLNNFGGWEFDAEENTNSR